MSDSLNASNIKSTLLELNKTIIDINQIAHKIQKGDGTVGKLVNNDSLYNNLNNSALHLDQLINEIQKNPGHFVRFSIFGKK